MDKEDKDWIDNASYAQLLAKCRFAPIGHRFFSNKTEVQIYFESACAKARNELTQEQRVGISKQVGWE